MALRRWFVLGLLASLLGFAPGAGASASGEALDRRRAPQQRRRPAVSPGFAAEGPDFYVWDEEAREVQAWAGELRTGRSGD